MIGLIYHQVILLQGRVAYKCGKDKMEE
jgi:hypothetical protein